MSLKMNHKQKTREEENNLTIANWPRIYKYFSNNNNLYFSNSNRYKVNLKTNSHFYLNNKLTSTKPIYKRSKNK